MTIWGPYRRAIGSVQGVLTTAHMETKGEPTSGTGPPATGSPLM